MFKNKLLDQNNDFTNQIKNILQMKDIVARYTLLTELYLTQAETMLAAPASADEKNENAALSAEKIDAINELLDLATINSDALYQLNDIYQDTGLTDMPVSDLINPDSIQDLKDKITTLTDILLNKIALLPSTFQKSGSYDVQIGIFSKPIRVLRATSSENQSEMRPLSAENSSVLGPQHK